MDSRDFLGDCPFYWLPTVRALIGWDRESKISMEDIFDQSFSCLNSWRAHFLFLCLVGLFLFLGARIEAGSLLY